MDYLNRKAGILSRQINYELSGQYCVTNIKYSHVVLICNDCKNNVVIQWKTFLIAVHRNKIYLCRKCTNKLMVQGSDFQSKIFKTKNTPEYKERASSFSRGLWKNPEFISKQKKSHQSDDFRRRVSANSNRLWKSSDYREKTVGIQNTNLYKSELSKKSKLKWKDPDYREKMSRIQNSSEYKEKLSEKSKELWMDPEYKEFQVQMSKNLWKNKNYRERGIKQLSSARHSLLTSGKDSILERVTQNIVSSLGLDFIRQFKIGYYDFDICIPEHNLLIECQGEYWHSHPRQKACDSSKFSYIEKYYPQYKILYLYEHEFISLDNICHKIKNCLFKTSETIEKLNVSISDIQVSSLNSTKIKECNSYYSAQEIFLHSYHHAGYGRAAKHVYGAYIKDQLICIGKFVTTQEFKIHDNICFGPSQILKLDRFCIHPQFNHEWLSKWFMNKCINLIFKDFPKIRILLSSNHLVDENTLESLNWINYRDSEIIYYFDKNGFAISQKKLQKYAARSRKKEAEYAEEFGYLKMYGKEKTKFILKRDL